MNVQVPTPMTADDFLRWNEGREGKRELVRGRIVEMMVLVSRNHVRLATSLTLALVTGLDRDAYDIGSADFGVRTTDGIRYPDVFVDRAIGDGKDLTAREPVLLAEILSPSSIARDFGEKAQEYTALPTLLHYLVLSQDEPRVWLWSRGEDGAFERPVMTEGRDESVTLSGFSLVLPLAELYRGVA